MARPARARSGTCRRRPPLAVTALEYRYLASLSAAAGKSVGLQVFAQVHHVGMAEGGVLGRRRPAGRRSDRPGRRCAGRCNGAVRSGRHRRWPRPGRGFADCGRCSGPGCRRFLLPRARDRAAPCGPRRRRRSPCRCRCRPRSTKPGRSAAAPLGTANRCLRAEAASASRSTAALIARVKPLHDAIEVVDQRQASQRTKTLRLQRSGECCKSSAGSAIAGDCPIRGDNRPAAAAARGWPTRC